MLKVSELKRLKSKSTTDQFLPLPNLMKTYKLKNKVLAYITRQTKAGPELLIFAHRDYPEAGLQVPGGTLDQGEDPLTGVLREVKEEAGLENFFSVKLVGKTNYVATEKQEIHQRHFFQLACEHSGEMTFPHTVTAGEADEGLVFLFRWVLLRDLPDLAADQGAMLAAVIRD